MTIGGTDRYPNISIASYTDTQEAKQIIDAFLA